MVFGYHWGDTFSRRDFLHTIFAKIEFPVIAFFVSLFAFLIVIGKWQESLTLGVAILLAAILGEGLLRVVDHPLSKPYLRQLTVPSSLLGHTLAPGFEGVGPGELSIKINSQGFRDIEHEWKKEPETFRIIGLGDSFAMGWGIPREKTFLQVLTSDLERKTGRQFEAINAGVPGWGLNHYYFFLKHIGHKYSSDVVIMAYYVDELGARFKDDVPGSSVDPFPAEPKINPLDFEVGGLHHFHLFNFFRSIAEKINYRSRSKRDKLLSNVTNRRKELMERKLYLLTSYPNNSQYEYQIALEKHLDRIKQITTDMGAFLIIMLIPDAAQLHHDEAQFINKILAEYTHKNDIPFLDMTPHFEKSSELSTYYLVPRDYHTNVLGHQIMADGLGPLVCRALRAQIPKC